MFFTYGSRLVTNSILEEEKAVHDVKCRTHYIQYYKKKKPNTAHI